MRAPSLRASLVACAVGVVVWGGDAAIARAAAAAPPRFKAIAFDYFVLFNPDSSYQQSTEYFPGKGAS